MNNTELTAAEKAEILHRGLQLRELMRHEAWPIFAHLFKNAVERLDSVQAILKPSGLLPLSDKNIAIHTVASKLAMDGMNEWMASVLQEVDRAVKLKEQVEKAKVVRKNSTTVRGSE